MASLIPWGVRTRPARYLSFLPMNHVVEGILGTYSAYDLPAPVEITFLEDFRRVASSLPEVRPTVFFSVPRVYERLWEGLERSPAGARYLAMRDGILRRILRPVVRRATLRRAGLDRCAQLIAGSAPVDDRLLASFRGSAWRSTTHTDSPRLRWRSTASAAIGSEPSASCSPRRGSASPMTARCWCADHR